jgi:hypothetical protein
MNREDIIRLAREAGIDPESDTLCNYDGWTDTLVNFAVLVAAAERNKLAAWMIQFGFATGHGDTMEQLVDALGSEIVDRIEFEIDVAVAAEREACAKVCEDMLRMKRYERNLAFIDAASAIRARGQA